MSEVDLAKILGLDGDVMELLNDRTGSWDYLKKSRYETYLRTCVERGRWHNLQLDADSPVLDDVTKEIVLKLVPPARERSKELRLSLVVPRPEPFEGESIRLIPAHILKSCLARRTKILIRI